MVCFRFKYQGMNSTGVVAWNKTLLEINETLYGNMTNMTNMTNMINSTNGTSFDKFVNSIYYEVNSIQNSQMIMGTMFLGMVLGMIIMVICCVKHKSDGYYRVPPSKTYEEVELVKSNNLQDERFEIGLDDDII